MRQAEILVQKRVKRAIAGIAQMLLIEEQADGGAPTERTVEAVTDQLYGKLDDMPPHLRAGMMGMTLVFDMAGVSHGGHRTHHLEVEQRRALLAQWKTGRLGPLRDFVAFYEKMGVFIYYSLLEEQHTSPDTDR